MDKQVKLESPRLLLRAAQEDDTFFLFEAFSDAEVMRYWSELPHADIDRTRAWVASMLESPQNGHTDFIVCLKPNAGSVEAKPVPIGKVGIYSEPPSNEIGFLLGRPYWGKGYAKEALLLILGRIFNLRNGNDSETAVEALVGREEPEEKADGDQFQPTVLSVSEQQSEWQYPSITADTEPHNVASIGLLKRLGFVEHGYAEKTFQLGEEWQDSLYLRIERETWKMRHEKGQ